ncbi:DUF1127 domain-containing protein [Roseococcus sp. SYP-B2431]|nr:DUF1127 domain-containing protein [Roseococcus sp. SYP-B2431]
MIPAEAAAWSPAKWPPLRCVLVLIEHGIAAMWLWTERARQRRRLGELCDRLLNDIGTTRHDAMVEARKPRWRR